MAAFEVLALDTATPQIRAPGASDTYTFPRAVELPLGTANGVLYLNASKVVTSGSSLTFNGTELSVGGPVRTGTDGSNVGLYLGASSIRQATTGGLFIDANSTGAAGGIFFRDSSSFTTRMQINSVGNLGLGTSTFGTSATTVFSIASGTEPSTGPANTVQFYSVDRSAGNTIPAFYCEGSGVTNAGITDTTVTHKIAMKINGTVYYLLATTNAT